MKIFLISDGKYGDRAIEIIKKKFKDLESATIEERPTNEIIDEYEFTDEIEHKIESSELIISYIRHPDINFELVFYEKPLIVAIYFGKGFLNQLKDENPNVVMPSSMCHLKPDSGIDIIDQFASEFGFPQYEIDLDTSKTKIEKIRAIVESPCGATDVSLKFIKGVEINPENINAFAINVAQECRESVSYMLSKTETAESATLNHVIPLLDKIESLNSNLIEEGGILHEYANDIRSKWNRAFPLHK